MSYYNTCPECGAHLDPGETCSCMKNTVLVLAHEDGEERAEQSSTNITTLHPQEAGCQEVLKLINEAKDQEAILAMSFALMHVMLGIRQSTSFSPDACVNAIKLMERTPKNSEEEAKLAHDACAYIASDWLGLSYDEETEVN